MAFRRAPQVSRLASCVAVLTALAGVAATAAAAEGSRPPPPSSVCSSSRRACSREELLSRLGEVRQGRANRTKREAVVRGLLARACLPQRLVVPKNCTDPAFPFPHSGGRPLCFAEEAQAAAQAGPCGSWCTYASEVDAPVCGGDVHTRRCAARPRRLQMGFFGIIPMVISGALAAGGQSIMTEMFSHAVSDWWYSIFDMFAHGILSFAVQEGSHLIISLMQHPVWQEPGQAEILDGALNDVNAVMNQVYTEEVALGHMLATGKQAVIGSVAAFSSFLGEKTGDHLAADKLRMIFECAVDMDSTTAAKTQPTQMDGTLCPKAGLGDVTLDESVGGKWGLVRSPLDILGFSAADLPRTATARGAALGTSATAAATTLAAAAVGVAALSLLFSWRALRLNRQAQQHERQGQELEDPLSEGEVMGVVTDSSARPPVVAEVLSREDEARLKLAVLLAVALSTALWLVLVSIGIWRL